MKKTLYLLIVGTILLLSVGCRGVLDKQSQPAEDDKVNTIDDSKIQEEAKKPLLIWSFTDELNLDVIAFNEDYNGDVRVELYEQDALMPVLIGTLKSGMDMPDVMILNDDQIGNEELQPFLYDLTAFVDKQNNKEDLVAYVLESNKNEAGQLLGLSYQISPVGVFYRRSMAIEAFGTDDPALVSQYFSSFYEMSNGFNKLSQHQIKAFADLFTLRMFGHMHQPWIDETGGFSFDPSLYQYFELLKKAQLEKQVAFSIEWSDEWFKGMHHPITNEYGVDMNVFAYVLPSWGLANILMLAGETEEPLQIGEDGTTKVFNETHGDWAVAKTAYPVYWGNSVIALNRESENLEFAQTFLDYLVFDQESILSRHQDSEYISSLNSVNTKQSFKLGDEFLGGQSYHTVFGEIGNSIVLQPLADLGLNKINEEIQILFDEIVLKFIQGEYHTIDEALNIFKNQVKEQYPVLFESVTGS